MNPLAIALHLLDQFELRIKLIEAKIQAKKNKDALNELSGLSNTILSLRTHIAIAEQDLQKGKTPPVKGEEV